MPDLPYKVRMSTTSGPMVPESTGNSRLLPSGSVSVDFLSMIVTRLCELSSSVLGGSKQRHDVVEVRFVPVAAADHDVPEIVVREFKDFVQAGDAAYFEISVVGKKALQNQV